LKGKRKEMVVGKAAGDERVFIPSRPPGWQMGVSDAIPATAGGEGVTGPLDRMA
jgi:hypothetical protein